MQNEAGTWGAGQNLQPARNGAHVTPLSLASLMDLRVIVGIGLGCGSFRVTSPIRPRDRHLPVQTGIRPFPFACGMEAPVLLEVTLGDHRAEGEDGLGAVQPQAAGNAEDQRLARDRSRASPLH
jgi:hypothetical protein